MIKQSKLLYFSLLGIILIFSFSTLLTGHESFIGNLDKETVKGDLGKKLDEYFTRITPFGFSGALLVAKDGKILLNKGCGLAIRSQNISNTAETVFSTGTAPISPGQGIRLFQCRLQSFNRSDRKSIW